ncbi:oligosaccharide flippase family protein [Bittarella massiliensis (ex Durand et al. 2017)]|uniref:oligosaccharide flippase family protein n=1 Tax=Bittarella massiliensis (ex Durand et al. 2017) TaxID=1720313 RepID=UPI0009470A27|nr:oligosaccharide flippase family protein [Bittarella massiliensis (ex Durand et al. 2017)]
MDIINRYKKLATDTALFTVSTFASKLLSIFMLPFYTNILTASDYGTADMITTTVSLIFPVLTMGICDGVLRFCLDKDSDKKAIFTIGLRIVLAGTALLVIATPILLVIGIPPLLVSMFLFTYITVVFTNMLNQFSRGIGETKVFAISGFLATATTIGFNILFLVGLKWGLAGYLLSTILSNTVCIIYVCVAVGIKKYIYLNKKLPKETQKEMLKYSVPLIPNSIAWWINLSSSRYLLTFLVGASANGIYAVANRLPTIITSLSDVFIRAWQLSAVSEFNAEDRNSFYRRVYRYYNAVIVLGCSAIILGIQVIAKILFSAEFYEGWRIAPFLMVSATFSAFSGFIGSLYTACKNTRTIFHTTVMGAAINLLLSVLLIPFLQGVGAGLASLISFIVIWAVRTFTISSGFESVQLGHPKYLLSYGLLIVQSCVLTFECPYYYLLMIVIFAAIVLLYWEEIVSAVKGGYRFLKCKGGKV